MGNINGMYIPTDSIKGNGKRKGITIRYGGEKNGGQKWIK